MNMICVLGSPRRDGNSATIARRFIETTEKLGANVRTFELNRLTYRGCQGCCACKTKLDGCAIKDDLSEVLGAIREADAVMLSTPVYFADVPGQVKCFIDRTFSYLKPNYMVEPSPSRVSPGKKAVLILTQGAPGGAMNEVRKRYESQMKFTLAVREVNVIRATSVGSGGIPKHVPEQYLLQAEELGRTLMAEVQQS